MGRAFTSRLARRHPSSYTGLDSSKVKVKDGSGTLQEVNPAMAVQFAVLASGSRGNSTLVHNHVAGLLIDVGMGPKDLGQRLELARAGRRSPPWF